MVNSSRKLRVVYTIPMFSQECVGTYARFHDVIHTLQKMDDPPWEYTIVPLRRYYGEPSPKVLFRDGSAPLRLTNYLRNVARASREADIVHVVEGSFPYSLLVPCLLEQSMPVVAGPNVTIGIDRTIHRQATGRPIDLRTLLFRSHNWNKLVFHRKSSLSRRYERVFVFKGYRSIAVHTGAVLEKKLVVLPSGVRRDIFSPSDNAPYHTGRFTILYIGDGRRAYLKGFDIFVKALTCLKEIGVPFRALMLGNYTDVDTLEIQKQGLECLVRPVGFIPRRDLVEYYRSADVYVCPSRYESNATTAIEALACGVPVIGTDLPGIDKTLEFRWADAEDLGSKLMELYRDLDKYRSKAVQESYKYNISNVIETLLTCYRQLLQ